MRIGSMWIREGRVVVFRTVDAGYKSKPPRIGIVIEETDDAITVRVACGHRRYGMQPVTVPKDLVAREATAREASLGYPVGPVPPRPEVES